MDCVSILPENRRVDHRPGLPADRERGQLALGYLVFEVSRMPAWRRFCGEMLGLPPPLRHPDGSFGWRLDELSQRLLLQPGPRDDLAAIGLAGDDATLDRLTARLAAAGHPAVPADDALRLQRRVARLLSVRDPDGNRVELVSGQAPARSPFESTAFPDGFRTGDLGLGHVVLASARPARLVDFYVGLLGFGITERLDARVGPLAVKGVFLHCNRRHHTIAILDLPQAKRLNHFMLQAPSIRDIGLARERAGRLGVPMSLDLGQHPAPDGTVSFYGRTPSGFDFEIGAGSGEIEPADWQPRRMDVTSVWGHAPSWRLKLRMASGLARRALSRAA